MNLNLFAYFHHRPLPCGASCLTCHGSMAPAARSDFRPEWHTYDARERGREREALGRQSWPRVGIAMAARRWGLWASGSLRMKMMVRREEPSVTRPFVWLIGRKRRPRWNGMEWKKVRVHKRELAAISRSDAEFLHPSSNELGWTVKSKLNQFFLKNNPIFFGRNIDKSSKCLQKFIMKSHSCKAWQKKQIQCFKMLLKVAFSEYYFCFFFATPSRNVI